MLIAQLDLTLHGGRVQTSLRDTSSKNVMECASKTAVHAKQGECLTDNVQRSRLEYGFCE